MPAGRTGSLEGAIGTLHQLPHLSPVSHADGLDPLGREGGTDEGREKSVVKGSADNGAGMRWGRAGVGGRR